MFVKKFNMQLSAFICLMQNAYLLLRSQVVLPHTHALHNHTTQYSTVYTGCTVLGVGRLGEPESMQYSTYPDVFEAITREVVAMVNCQYVSLVSSARLPCQLGGERSWVHNCRIAQGG